ncbi:MAG: peptide-modifying radical SAM enzyme CbpB [Planctomycetes bacterium]|nr:peptide-modifying radical SAM enzyme CbpB [Planctomycetota bacterium]
MTAKKKNDGHAPSRGMYYNSGNGASLVPIDIGHKQYMGLIDPDTAFWSLVKKNKLGEVLDDSKFIKAYGKKAESFAKEMHKLRFELNLSAVYFNPTERCNLNCKYCYIPETMRKKGKDMKKADMFKALTKLRSYFRKIMPKGRLPQIIFHGAEPMINREAMFGAIEKFQDDFRFGVQTNGTLLDDEAIEFLTSTGTGIGLSLDAPTPKIANKTRTTWEGDGVFENTLKMIDKLRGYKGYNVICTVTKENMAHLPKLVDFFHGLEIPAIMMNILRCTLPRSRNLRPDDHKVATHFFAALDRTHELYKKTGRKMVVANFANILVSILAPTARRLMCDISPCGGGRAFFALAPDGGMFPCSEFIGLPEFKGGNLFTDNIDKVLKTEAFRKVTERKVEDIDPCNRCAIRHFCGSPCPAEAHEMNGGMDKTGAFCEFYEEQVRYAFRLIAERKEADFLWDEWDKDTQTTFDASMLS